jgi:hypothetical protein
MQITTKSVCLQNTDIPLRPMCARSRASTVYSSFFLPTLSEAGHGKYLRFYIKSSLKFIFWKRQRASQTESTCTLSSDSKYGKNHSNVAIGKTNCRSSLELPIQIWWPMAAARCLKEWIIQQPLNQSQVQTVKGVHVLHYSHCGS